MESALQLSPILVADDNPNDVFFLRRRLQAAGVLHPVEHVEDGYEAIQWLERRLSPDTPPAARPWLVFLDLKMPRKDGFEVLQWVAAKGLADSLTVVVLSTSDEPVDIARAAQLGAHKFLVKYPQPEDLLTVAQLANNRMAARAAQDARRETGNCEAGQNVLRQNA